MIPKHILHRSMMFNPPAAADPPTPVTILTVTTDPRNANYARWYHSSAIVAASVDPSKYLVGANAGATVISSAANCVVIDHGAAVSGGTYTILSASTTFYDGLSISDYSQTGTVVACTTEQFTESGTWVCPANVDVAYLELPPTCSLGGLDSTNDYIVERGKSYAIDITFGTITIGYKASTVGSPALLGVSVADPDSHNYWDFSNTFTSSPSVGNVACLQKSDGLGGWLTPTGVTLPTVNAANSRLEVEYSDSGGNDYRVNGSTAGLAFAGGGTLLTGVTGTIT